MKRLKIWLRGLLGSLLEFVGEKLFGNVVKAVNDHREEITGFRMDIEPITTKAATTIEEEKKAELEREYGCSPVRQATSITERDAEFRKIRRRCQQHEEGPDQVIG